MVLQSTTINEDTARLCLLYMIVVVVVMVEVNFHSLIK